MRHIINIIIVLMSLVINAQDNTFFDQGNKYYNEGKYELAIVNYEAIVKSGKHSAELYFNIANAHYKLNNIAPSIYYYEKALLLSPNDNEIKNNLTFAQNMLVDNVEALPQVGFSKYINAITNKFSFDVWAIITVILIFLFVLSFIIYYFSITSSVKRITFISCFASIILACITISFAFHKYDLTQNNVYGIVFKKESIINNEPNIRSSEAFVLHEGTKVQILDSINNWKKIKLVDGKTGWILNSDVKSL